MITNKNFAIIAGNAPSLTNIDYRRLPKEFDIFRCNQFYFEDCYFLGKNIKYACFNPRVFIEQRLTAQQLIDGKEYHIENIVCSAYSDCVPYPNSSLHIEKIFKSTLMGYTYIEKLPKLADFLIFNEIYYSKRPTSGVFMCALATALGYKELYLAGIDSYSNGSTYAFSHQNNIIELIPSFKDAVNHDAKHTIEYDLEVLNFLVNEYKIKIYTLCPSSPITAYFPLAEINQEFSIEKIMQSLGIEQNDFQSFEYDQNIFHNILKKREHITKDILIPLPHTYKKINIIKQIYTNSHNPNRSTINFKKLKNLIRRINPSKIFKFIK